MLIGFKLSPMRFVPRPSIKRSLCGLLAVLMSLQGVTVAASTFARDALIEAIPTVAAPVNEDMPCHEMTTDESDIAVQLQPQTVPDEDCDSDCCAPDHGCGMAYCMAGSCLPASVPAAQFVPYAAATTEAFPPPALGWATPARGPPLRPPIA